MKRKGKSLRQLAKELGVSASYLSQINHGKRRASHKVLSNPEFEVLSSVKQTFSQNAIIPPALPHDAPGEVSELADEHDLGSCGATRGGSTPPFPTSKL